jgi:hypothetical protein
MRGKKSTELLVVIQIPVLWDLWGVDDHDNETKNEERTSKKVMYKKERKKEQKKT